MPEESGKFIEIGMPGSDCCICELQRNRNTDTEICSTDPENFPPPSGIGFCAFTTTSGDYKINDKYTFKNYQSCILSGGGTLVQHCVSGDPLRDTTHEYPIFIVETGTCSDGSQTITLGVPTGTFIDDCDPGVSGLGCGWFSLECSGEDPCRPFCEDPKNLYSDIQTDPLGVCFPYTCCACPPSGAGNTRTASLTAGTGIGAEYVNLLSVDIPMSSDKSGMCHLAHGIQGNIPCYGDLGPYHGSGVNAEKYGVEDFALCSASGSCSGQKIDATLCCCDTPGSQGGTEGQQDCHTCNYQFTMSFLPLQTSPSIEYCFCPQSTGMEIVTHLVPGDDDVGNGLKAINTEFTLVDGTCEPFLLEYVASGLYWNCDCLLGGDEADVDNDVTIRVTIT